MRLLLSLMPLLAASPALSQDRDAVSDFLYAADENDFETMRSLMASDAWEIRQGTISLDRFFEKIDDCYLRTVYTAERVEVLASWMCAEGEQGSRTVMALLSPGDEGIEASITLQYSNMSPAPPREGSALRALEGVE